MKHTYPSPANRHWPFGVKLKPDSSAFERLLGVINLMLECATCDHPPGDIAKTVIEDYPVLLVGTSPGELARKHPAIFAELAPQFSRTSDPAQLGRISQHALFHHTTEDVLKIRMQYCFLCARQSTMRPHWLHYGDREQEQLLFSLCQRCTEYPDREERISRETDHLIAAGICLCCGEQRTQHVPPLSA